MRNCLKHYHNATTKTATRIPSRTQHIPQKQIPNLHRVTKYTVPPTYTRATKSQIMIITHYIILFVSTWKNIFMQFLPILFLTPVGSYSLPRCNLILVIKRVLVLPSSVCILSMNDLLFFSAKKISTFFSWCVTF